MGIINKLFDKFVILIFAVFFIVAFRSMVLTDDLLGEVFAKLIGLLPFAEEISEPIMTILQCKYEVPIINTGDFVSDLLRLIMMACLQPLFMGLLSFLFLTIPSGLNSYEMEDYTNTFRYRCKELVIHILGYPFLAALSVWLSDLLMSFLLSKLGTIGGILTGIGGILAGLALSTIPLIATLNMTLGLAILTRLCITLLPEIVETLITSTLCIAVYVALAGGIQSQIILTIGVLILWLMIWNICFQGMLSSVARRNLSRKRR